MLFNVTDGPHYTDWGILELRVSDLKALRRMHPDPKNQQAYTFDVAHLPERCMYPHSELKLLLGGVEKDDVGNQMKLWIREKLHELATTRRLPNTKSPTVL